MRNFKSVAFIVSTAALLAACSSPTKLNETPVVEKSPTPAYSPRTSTVPVGSSVSPLSLFNLDRPDLIQRPKIPDTPFAWLFCKRDPGLF